MLFNVQERDVGAYVCRADNGNGRTTAQAITNIKSILGIYSNNSYEVKAITDIKSILSKESNKGL